MKPKQSEDHVKVYMFIMCSLVFIGVVYRFETFGADAETKNWSVFIGLSMLCYLYGGTYMIVMIRYCVDKVFQMILLLFLMVISGLVVYVTFKIGTTTTFEHWMYIGQLLVQIGFNVYHVYTIWYYANLAFDATEYMTTGDGKKYAEKCVKTCC